VVPFVFVALVAWDTRNIWLIHEPMHGWPIPWNNLWYLGHRRWSPRLLLFDVSVWFVLGAAAAYIAARLLSFAMRRQFALSSVLGLLATVAALLSLWRAEDWLRKHPGNDAIVPRYGRINIGGTDVWFDLGLFTDPPDAWLPVRIPIIVSIGCAVVCAVNMSFVLVRAIRNRAYRTNRTS
jgi:hypothetical protein